jgi:hypothetical protein
MDAIGTSRSKIFFTVNIYNIYKIFTADFCMKGTHNGKENAIFQTLLELNVR